MSRRTSVVSHEIAVMRTESYATRPYVETNELSE
jgi:hypothetical protein